MGCLNCGKELVHTPGKRPKKFCSNSCRSGYSQKKKKGKEGEPKRGPGRPVFKSRTIAPSSEPIIQPEKPFPQKEDEKVRVFRPDGTEILPEVFDAPKLKSVQNEPKYFAPVNQAVIDKYGATFPSDPQELLRIAKNGVSDKEAFRKHVADTKMAPRQRDMIYSKLKS